MSTTPFSIKDPEAILRITMATLKLAPADEEFLEGCMRAYAAACVVEQLQIAEKNIVDIFNKKGGDNGKS